MKKIRITFNNGKDTVKLSCVNTSGKPWKMKGCDDLPEKSEDLAQLLADIHIIDQADRRDMKRLLDDVHDLVFPMIPF